MTRDEAIGKILKCLRLGKSANEHEAAAALRQAQKLIAMYSITDGDLLAADVEAASVKSNAAEQPAQWEALLVDVCANAFGCEYYFEAGYAWLRERGRWIFIAPDSRQVLCQYAFEVLFRQCRRARATYIKSTLRRCGQHQRTARADVFCRAWIHAVESTVEAFAWPDGQRGAVAAWKSLQGLKLSTLEVAKRKPRGGAEVRDYLAGAKAADGVRLDRPVPGQTREALQ